MMRCLWCWYGWLVILLVLGMNRPDRFLAEANIFCSTANDCQTMLQRSPSECHDETGACTNPYHYGGCLSQSTFHQQQQAKRHRRRREPTTASLNSLDRGSIRSSSTQQQSPAADGRICHSEDSSEAVANRFCRTPEIAYPEIRIRPPNWESAIFVSWVLQIVLTEIGNVPATIESGQPDLNLDFYNVHPTFGIPGERVNWEGIRRASEHGNCVQFYQQNPHSGPQSSHADSYQSCMDVVPELWNGAFETVQDLLEAGYADGLQGLGALGIESWFIPRLTLQQDPSLVTYLGLMGEANRRKLADTFLRPTTWGQYCTEVSPTACQAPDTVAERAPRGIEEEERMFVEGLYTGHFRKTEENDCDKWPQNCTGHIVDWPCDWVSHVEAQAHHLNIALKSSGTQGRSGGYTSSQLVEIWDAANATQSHVLMFYWSPSVLNLRYAATSYEMMKVSLPPSTQQCARHRVDGTDRCEAANAHNETLLFGDPRGACDEEPHVLATAVGASVRSSAQNPDVFKALHSPAYEMVRNFRITEFQIGQMLERFLEGTTGDIGIDGRDAVCSWVVEHKDMLTAALLPPTFPRTIAKTDRVFAGPWDAFLVALACVAVLVALLGKWVARELWLAEKIHQYQVDFVSSYILGLLGAALAALIMCVATLSNAICVTVEFLIQFGYVFVLVPLVAEVKFLKVSDLSRDAIPIDLFLEMTVACLLMLSFLLLWTLIDPPQRSSLFELGGGTSESLVFETFFCASKHDGWSMAGVLWPLGLLFAAFARALQTHAFGNHGNGEARVLVLLTYSHSLFAAMRAITFFAQDLLGPSHAARFRSLLLSLDVIATVTIYFTPKIFPRHCDDESNNLHHSFASTISSFQEMSRGVRAVTIEEHQLARLAVASLASNKSDQHSRSTGAASRHEQECVGPPKYSSSSSSSKDDGSDDCDSEAEYQNTTDHNLIKDKESPTIDTGCTPTTLITTSESAGGSPGNRQSFMSHIDLPILGCENTMKELETQFAESVVSDDTRGRDTKSEIEDKSAEFLAAQQRALICSIEMPMAVPVHMDNSDVHLYPLQQQPVEFVSPKSEASLEGQVDILDENDCCPNHLSGQEPDCNEIEEPVDSGHALC